MPSWETNVAGHTLMWNVLLPAVVLPALLFAVLYAYPFAEQRLTGEWRHEHHLCDRPRERPVRTGLGVAGIVFYGVLMLAGGNDIIADIFQISLNALTWVLRIALVLGPVVAFLVTRGLCHALLRKERMILTEGEETGEVRQTVTGGYESGHRPVELGRPGAPLRAEVTRPGERTGTPSPQPPEPAPRDR